MKAPKTLLLRNILWTCEHPGSWVSKIGRIELRSNPRRWVWWPPVLFAAASPDVRAEAAGMRSCAILAAVRYDEAKRSTR